MPPRAHPFHWPARTDAGWVALVFIAAFLYLWGLGGPYVPTNGDEMVYLHIARLTAESGHWLPLQSDLAGMRNTKPPLLIWQAIAAGDWGRHWSLWALRLPSSLYTFATAAVLGFFAFCMTEAARDRWRNACRAAALYLLFFSTFRYGRAYLTSAPETFWLALALWWALWIRLRRTPATGDASADAALPGWIAYSLMGLTMGLGAAYKSFALVAPAAGALWCALLLGERRWRWSAVLRVTLGVAWSTVLGLAVFALWFLLDPDPAAVWQEFVLGENAAKMSGGQGYWHAALYGVYPMWPQLFAYPANAGLLALPATGFCWMAVSRLLRRRTGPALTPAMRVLVVWLVVWLVVFTIPSQRSERYVIPAMPALAIAMALYWERIGRVWFVLTLLLTAVALVLLARIGWVIGGLEGLASDAGRGLTLLAAGLGLGAAGLGLARPRWTRNAVLVACAALYGTFGAMVAPLSGADAGYSAAVQRQMQDRRVAVPNGFTGQYERFHWVLPGARTSPYDTDGRSTDALYPGMPPQARLARLLQEFDAVVWVQDDAQQDQPSCLPQCRVLGQRWHVRSRHKGGEVTLANVWYPQDWLFRREWLLAPAGN